MKKVEKLVAKALLEIEAVRLSAAAPFTWASGWKAPIYCDNRRILSFPKIRTLVCEAFVDIIKEKYSNVNVIAGVATGAIGYGAIVAQMMGLPFVYIRPQAKNHGMGNQVEGTLPEDARAVVIEDLISTGKSSLAAATALQNAGALIEGMVAIFSYNFPESRKSFEDRNIELRTLTNYDSLIEEALSSKYIQESELELLREWRFTPDTWGQNNN